MNRFYFFEGKKQICVCFIYKEGKIVLDDINFEI